MMRIAERGEKRDRSLESELEWSGGASEEILERLNVARVISVARR